MTGEVILRDAQGETRLVMSRPDPPASDTIVKISTHGHRILYRFTGCELDVPVYEATLGHGGGTVQ